MTKEQELMNFLHLKIFDPILSNPNVPANIKRGVNLTIGRMGKLSAEKMIQYYWTALSADNAISFSKKMKAEGFPRFEDILEEFRDKFNDEWLRK